MRKAIAIVLILAFAISSVSAAGGRVSINAYPDFMFLVSIIGFVVVLMAEGANFLDDEGQYGIEYGAGAYFPVADLSGNSESSDTVPFLLYKLGMAYRRPFSEKVALTVGCGIQGRTSFIALEESSLGMSILDIYVSVGTDIRFTPHFGLSAGAHVGALTFLMATSNDPSNPAFGIAYYPGIIVAPYVGASFFY